MVFIISVIIILLFVGVGAFFPEHLAEISSMLLNVTNEKFGWFYLLSVIGFLVFVIYLSCSKYGKIKLGKDEDEPEFSNLSWFGMLFCAGTGVGLVFWGVSEPMSHYITPPTGTGQTLEAAQEALRYSFFHWGIHGWAIFATIALALAYFKYRKGYKGLISFTFYPLLGERVNGPIGKAIDIFAIVTTAFGVATSLGMGALQTSGGLSFLFGLTNNATLQIIVIAFITVCFIISASTGLTKGIQKLSSLNLYIAFGLMIAVLFLGPTSFIFDSLTTSIGSYIQNLPQMGLTLSPFSDSTWVEDWTVFYWAWWISWAPFVGMFIARISKGRTIREFVLGVLLAPSAFCFTWFSIFGGSALYFEVFGNIDVVSYVQNDTATALFATLANLPLGDILGVVSIALIIIFLVTSADSATFVLGMFSSDGKENPTIKTKLTWGVLQSSIAAVLLISGGLAALQTTAVVAALPFAVIMVFMSISLMTALREEVTSKRLLENAEKAERHRQIELNQQQIELNKQQILLNEQQIKIHKKK